MAAFPIFAPALSSVSLTYMVVYRTYEGSNAVTVLGQLGQVLSQTTFPSIAAARIWDLGFQLFNLQRITIRFYPRASGALNAFKIAKSHGKELGFIAR